MYAPSPWQRNAKCLSKTRNAAASTGREMKWVVLFFLHKSDSDSLLYCASFKTMHSGHCTPQWDSQQIGVKRWSIMYVWLLEKFVWFQNTETCKSWIPMQILMFLVNQLRNHYRYPLLRQHTKTFLIPTFKIFEVFTKGRCRGGSLLFSKPSFCWPEMWIVLREAINGKKIYFAKKFHKTVTPL